MLQLRRVKDDLPNYKKGTRETTPRSARASSKALALLHLPRAFTMGFADAAYRSINDSLQWRRDCRCKSKARGAFEHHPNLGRNPPDQRRKAHCFTSGLLEQQPLGIAKRLVLYDRAGDPI